MCGLSGGYVKNMRNELGRQKLEDVLNAFPEISREWLILGTGEMFRTPQNAVNILNGNNNTNNGHISVTETNMERLKNENEALKAENGQLKRQVAQLTDIISNITSK